MMSRLTSLAAAVAVLAMPAIALAQTATQPFVRDIAGEMACGARAVLVSPTPSLRISGGFEPRKGLFAIGDEVLISGGTSQGVQPGQVYFVRRAVADRFMAPTSDGLPIRSIHTAGWLRIVEARADVAVAAITQACDGIETGDYLEAFELRAVPPPLAAGEPDYSAPGHILLGDDRRQVGSAGSLMVMDRGSDHGVKAGQRLTIYRETLGGTGPASRIGEATALVVHPETTLVRIEYTRDAVYVGDLIALQR